MVLFCVSMFQHLPLNSNVISSNILTVMPEGLTPLLEQVLQEALIISAMVFMVPVILFSGMIYPITNMPVPLQYFSAIIPARWYVEALRKLMIQQLPLNYVIEEIAVLTVMTVLIHTVAIRKFNSR